MNRKIETNNMLMAINFGMETNVDGYDVLHVYMEDNAGIAHHVAFAMRPNYSAAIAKACRRLAPVQLPQPAPAIDQPVVDAE